MCCHLSVGSATAGVRVLNARKHRAWTLKFNPHSHVCLPHSLSLSRILSLSLNVYEPPGAVYEKFIGSVGRVANIMLNIGSVFSPPHAMTPPVSHVFQQMGLFQREQRWQKEETVCLVSHY